MTLKEQVDALLPGWEAWYPSLFDAARDLGVIRARVCAPSSLLLSSRHGGVRQQAEDAYREQWGGTGEHVPDRLVRKSKSKRKRRGRR